MKITDQIVVSSIVYAISFSPIHVSLNVSLNDTGRFPTLKTPTTHLEVTRNKVICKMRQDMHDDTILEEFRCFYRKRKANLYIQNIKG